MAALLQAAGWDRPPDGVQAALAGAMARAGADWPNVPLPAADFAAAVGASIADEDDPVGAIASLHASDLWLAGACALGQRAALDEVERRLVGLRPTLARTGVDPDHIDDLLQQIRARLFAASEDRPARIRGYRGRGDLRSWLKVVVVRDGLRASRRAAQTPSPSHEIDILMDPDGDPELGSMLQTYRESFRAAFAHALSELSARDRNVLRYHLIDSLAIDELGSIYRVHRSTAARWLVRIREGLYAATRRRLMQQLRLTPREFDSVLRLIRSRLDASIAGGLQSDVASQ